MTRFVRSHSATASAGPGQPVPRPTPQPARSGGKAAVAWAELAQFMAQEPDPALRQQAAQLLGLPALPPGLFDQADHPLHNETANPQNQPKPQKRPSPPPPKPSDLLDPQNWPRRPLQISHLWAAHTELLPTPAPVPLPARPERLSPAQAAEVDAWLRPTPGAAPPFAPRWPQQDPQHRALRRVLQGLPVGFERDWRLAQHRIALAHWPWPLPWRQAKAPAKQVVFVLDWAEPLRVFRDDLLALAQDCAQRWPSLRVQVDALEGGPTGTLQSAALNAAPNAAHLNAQRWTEGTVLVLVSDFGHHNAALKAQWQRLLRRLRQRVGAVFCLDPCLPPSGLATPAPESSNQDLGTLLAALSPALTVEPYLLRALRLALCPRSGPALERQIWAHPDLVGNLPHRQWRPERREPHQKAAQQLSPAQRLRLMQVYAQQHTQVCQVQRDEELLHLHSLCDPAVQTLAQSQGIALPDFAQAEQGVARVALRLRDLANPPDAAALPDGYAAPQDAPSSTARLAAHAAQQRIWRIPQLNAPLDVQAQIQQCLYQAAQAAQANGPALAVPRGFKPPPSPALEHPIPIGLYQQGERLVLWARSFSYSSYFNVGLNPQQVALKRQFQNAPKCLLASAEVQDAELVCTAQGQTLAIQTRALQVPLTVFDGSAANQATDAEVLVSWRSGQLKARPTPRPPWAHAFSQTPQGLHALVQSPAGQWHHLDPLLAEQSVQASEQWTLGVDKYGLYANAQLTKTVMQKGAKHKTPLPPFTLRYIPPGTFLMGSPEGEGYDDEHPQHPVTLSQGFWLADTPVTQALWQAVMGKNPSHFKNKADARQCPVERVSHEDAQAFLKKLQTLLPLGVQAVLPTEAQWEYACRAGTTTAYAWGDTFKPEMANADHKNEKGLDDPQGTSPVKTYPPNPWGLYDMHGNVWEWCADAMRDYKPQTEQDPEGENGVVFAVRGGSWITLPGHAHSAFRYWRHAGNRDLDLGLRFALRSSSTSPAPAPSTGLGPEGQG